MASSRPQPSWASKAAAGFGSAGVLAPFFQPDFQNPADAAMPYLDQLPDAIKPYYQSYIDRGNNASDTLSREYGEQINDPGGLSARLGAGYKESPGYQFKLHQALSAGDNAAAAGGLAGSNQHQQGNMQLANDISSQDFNDYMSRILGIYQGGIKGNEGFAERGYNASNELGQSIGNNYLNKAGLAYKGAGAENEYNQAQTKAMADMWGNLAGVAGNAIK